MRFVALFNLKDGVDQKKITEVIHRRADYDHPVQLVEEFYTPNRSPAVIAIYETDDANQLVTELPGLDGCLRHPGHPSRRLAGRDGYPEAAEMILPRRS